MNTKYRGYFGDLQDNTWTVEILTDEDTAEQDVGTLVFGATPLTISWPEKAKHEALCGATATLTIESPGDRTYIGLYSEVPGSVALRVYRNDSLYWTGVLDPEFYEEPYERFDTYDVELTFVDFGVLERLKYDGSDYANLLQLVTTAVSRSGISPIQVLDRTSTSVSGSSSPSGVLSQLTVDKTNWYDEDGEAMNLKDVVEGVLTPLGARMVQLGGYVWIYDLHRSHTDGSASSTSHTVEWSSNSQTYGTDRVYNNVAVTWDPYVADGKLNDTDLWDEGRRWPSVNALDEGFASAMMLDDVPDDYLRFWVCSYHTAKAYDNSEGVPAWADSTDNGFNLWTIAFPDKEAATLDRSGILFYHLQPRLDGSESDGVALSFLSWQKGTGSNAGKYARRRRGLAPHLLCGSPTTAGDALFHLSSFRVPWATSSAMLRVSCKLLMDPRVNFFEETETFWWKDTILNPRYGVYVWGHGSKDWTENFNKRGNFVYVPVKIKYTPDGGGSPLWWTNLGAVTSSPVWSRPDKLSRSQLLDIDDIKGSWSETETYGFLAWYDVDDRSEKSAVASGFASNRQAIPPINADAAHGGYAFSARMKNCDDGQYIPFPSSGTSGTLDITVLDNWAIVDGGYASLGTGARTNPYEIWGFGDPDTEWASKTSNWIECGSQISWLLMELPEVEVVSSSSFVSELDGRDVQYKADIDVDASEELTIRTVCGTSADPVIGARGVFRDMSGNPVTSLGRAGRTDTAEELLIGTVYSQYATRSVKLSGEMYIPDYIAGDGDMQPMRPVKVATEPGKLFVVAGMTQDLMQGTMDATLVELKKEEYVKAV